MARKNDILSIYTKEVEQIKADGLFKGEAPFVSPQGAKVVMEDGRELLNMCANNYLGLGDNQRLIDAAKRTYDEKGYVVASVRFICGTQDIHKKLEKKISGFLGTDDTILYSSCFLFFLGPLRFRCRRPVEGKTRKALQKRRKPSLRYMAAVF